MLLLFARASGKMNKLDFEVGTKFDWKVFVLNRYCSVDDLTFVKDVQWFYCDACTMYTTIPKFDRRLIPKIISLRFDTKAQNNREIFVIRSVNLLNIL